MDKIMFETYSHYLGEVDLAVWLVKPVFTNGDGTRRVLYLATSDLTLGSPEIPTVYKKRRSVEERHQSLKGNASIISSSDSAPYTAVAFQT